eukprot:gnl/TRDRNA2_/TRDRNA2_167208_c0_seq1.p2 gnl/TRDRNA2_/TRDRNA2_167208_c0~~gnl/TRDRNA2_/TRDRNA2_167208_c0_seq1.p2  ORF type:complete len:164 (-),score=43.26 gnl/TRDRNA2_/TRDRNA2_167208_c0_seq1:32-523(-)
MASLPERLAAERAAVDREGAVLYLESAQGEPVGLVKVKSDFYVKARRTRQIFWGAVADPILKGESLEGEAKKVGTRRGAGVGWDACEKRLRAGMKELMHVEGCTDHWKDWADAAVGFLEWWKKKYDALGSTEARKNLARVAKDKFGTTYRDYCRDRGLPGGEN